MNEYVLDQLDSGRSLAAMVQKKTTLENGAYFVLVPEFSDAYLLRDLRIGDPSARDEALLVLSHAIERFLQSSRNTLLLDSLAELSDPFLQRYPYKDRVVAYRQEVYYCLTDPCPPEPEIREVTRRAGTYPFLGYFFTRSAPETISYLAESDLRQIAKNLLGLAISVFDAESFLLWWRTDLVPLPAESA